MVDLVRGIGNIVGWVDWFKKVIEEMEQHEDFTTGALMLAHADQFAVMGADVAEAVKDGLQLHDIVLLGDLVPDIMKIAAKIEGAAGAEKRQFVIDVIWVIYHSVDTGPDGKHNRIKVPGAHWLSKLGFTSTEESIERFILKIGTEFAIKAAYSLLKEKSDV